MTRRIERLVFLVAVACGTASFTHFAHNAEFCGEIRRQVPGAVSAVH